MLGKLLTVLLSQSRFLGESLAVLTSPASFSRFVIAPSDDQLPKDQSALQCALLGAFGGFFERGFRRHDYLLGRRNCQRFLKAHFRLPVSNPVIVAGQATAGANSTAIRDAFRVAPPPLASAAFGPDWFPLIPCVGTADPEVARPDRVQLASDKLDEIVDSIVARLKAIRPQLLDGAPGFLKSISAIAFWPIIVNTIKNALRDTLERGLCPNVEGQSSADCRKTGSTGS